MSDHAPLSATPEQLDWDARRLLPTIVQDATTGQILMLAYMNRESLQKSIESGETWFWSRSRQTMWHKGATSGNTQRIVEIIADCDTDALLVRVNAAGPACHTGRTSCFHRPLAAVSVLDRPNPPEHVERQPMSDTLSTLQATILDRMNYPREGSYTCSLLQAGESEILKKLGEEAVEVVVAGALQGNDRMIYESADLVYHLLVALVAKGLTWEAVEAELARRFK